MQESIETLKRGIEELEKMALNGKESFQATAADIKKMTQKEMKQLKKTAEEALEEAKDSAEAGLKTVSKLIKKHPLESVAIGVGVGCLIGLWLRKKD